MASATLPHAPHNTTASIPGLQRTENRSQDEFLGHLPGQRTLATEHIGLKNSQSATKEAGSSGETFARNFRPRGRPTSSELDPQIYTNLSLNLWKRINAGYIIPKSAPEGVTHSTYQYNPKLVDKKSTQFHRKRDFYSEYNEAAARFKLVFGNKKPLPRPAGKGKERSKSLPISRGAEKGNEKKLEKENENHTPTEKENTTDSTSKAAVEPAISTTEASRAVVQSSESSELDGSAGNEN